MTTVIGDIRVQSIIEQETPLAPILDVFPGLTPELLDENRAFLQPKALDAADTMIVCIQSFVLRTPHHTVLVDSCVGNDKDRPARPHWNRKTDTRFMDGLAAAGLRVEDIDYVMCTHLHVDHVGWNTRLLDGRWVPTFPKARYIFAKTEYDHWEGQNAATPNPVFNDSVLPIIEAGRADLVASDHGVGDHLRFMPTPGHTPGHVSVLLGKLGREGVITGDLIHSPIQMRHPELSIKFDTDQAQAAVTRRGFLEQFCETGVVCCFTHFPSPSLARIGRRNGGFRCEPA